MSRRTSMTLKITLLLLVSLGFNQPSCDLSPGDQTCDTVSVTLEPGTCVEITNPCGDHHWDPLGALRLCDAPDGLFIRTNGQQEARFLCAATNTPQLVEMSVDYFYADPFQSSNGQFRVTVGVGGPIAVGASANPTSIASGGTSLLNATVSGGAAPYTFSWSGPGLSDPNIASPTAMPSITTEYTVEVTDSRGAIASDTVFVNVGVGVTAVANPPTINPGQSSSLLAQVSGGTPPYSYAWMPSSSLSAANVSDPTAIPSTTTMYTVTINDSLGASAVASSTVVVNLLATANASPGSIAAGGQSQLGVQVQGGAPPYTFAWEPAATLNDPTLRNPLAMPTQTTPYNVLITDFLGNSTNSSVTVQVAGTVQACFTVSGSGLVRNLDGSCSTGSGLTYRWWCDFRGGAQPPNSAGPNSFFTCLYETPGSKMLRLEVFDGSGNISATTQTSTVP